MQISYMGIQTLKEREGFRAKAYKDGGGVWTIGYGTTKVDGRPVEEGMECTREQAEVWLYQDLASTQTAINQLVRVLLSQHQFDALCLLVYNIGEGAFGKSTMLRKLNTQDYIGAAKEFDRWVYDEGKVVKGLIMRRRIERDIFEGHSNQS